MTERGFFPQVFGQAKRDAHHASISERVDYIEKQLGDSADQHSLIPRHTQIIPDHSYP